MVYATDWKKSETYQTLKRNLTVELMKTYGANSQALVHDYPTIFFGDGNRLMARKGQMGKKYIHKKFRGKFADHGKRISAGLSGVRQRVNWPEKLSWGLKLTFDAAWCCRRNLPQTILNFLKRGVERVLRRAGRDNSCLRSPSRNPYRSSL